VVKSNAAFIDTDIIKTGPAMTKSDTDGEIVITRDYGRLQSLTRRHRAGPGRKSWRWCRRTASQPVKKETGTADLAERSAGWLPSGRRRGKAAGGRSRLYMRSRAWRRACCLAWRKEPILFSCRMLRYSCFIVEDAVDAFPIKT
jgi:hypothetical protein